MPRESAGYPPARLVEDQRKFIFSIPQIAVFSLLLGWLVDFSDEVRPHQEGSDPALILSEGDIDEFSGDLAHFRKSPMCSFWSDDTKIKNFFSSFSFFCARSAPIFSRSHISPGYNAVSERSYRVTKTVTTSVNLDIFLIVQKNEKAMSPSNIVMSPTKT